MSQSPLAPPPQTGQPIDSWLYLLWRRLTATGQMLWSSIVPGTSADVAAVVTDETGSPGSLVFSGNPTLAGITNSGNLAFTGTGNRITGDFSNATFANRVIFQTSTVNGNSAMSFIPNGTGIAAQFHAYNSSDPDNSSRLNFSCIGTGIDESRISSDKFGAGSYLPIRIYTGGVVNVGIAVDGTVTLGGTVATPALKVTPVASQARWIEVTGATSGAKPTISTSGGNLAITPNTDFAGVVTVGDTTTPTGITLLNALFSTDTGSGNNVVFRKCNNGVNTPNFTFAKGRGTAASPSAVQANDGLGAINFYGYDGTNYVQAGYLVSYVDGTVSTGVVPSRVSINVNSSAGSSTEAFAISSAQVVTLGGVNTAPAMKVTPVASQARWIEVTGATSSGNPTIGVSGGILAISTSVAITGVVSTSGYTVATLPAGTVGQRAYVTDALAPAYGVAVAGGGAVTVPVFYNGAAWICA